MNHQLLLKKLAEDTLPYLPDESTKNIFLAQIKQLEKGFKKEEFKLKRTIQDKQITTNVLENTISELKKQSENLKIQKALTEEQARFKEQLFANVSHELRTPLHGILGMSHLLGNTPLDKEQKGYVDIVRGSADNLLVIINDLLNLSKINAGKTVLLNEPFSINKLFHDLKGVLAFKAKSKGLKLVFSKPQNLPEYLIGDKTRLYQILLNLLNNAIKFTHKGAVLLNIFVLNKNPKKFDLTFEIKDTGVGIAADKLDSIFDSFTQLENQKGDIYGGVGLGLNIVRKLLIVMNGTIRVTSLPQNGTTFSVNLSFAIPNPQDIEVLPNAYSALHIPTHWLSKNILLIEDNEANLVYTKNMFANWGIQLAIAENLAEAKRKIVSTTYDCILSDVQLPDGNGMDLIAQLRADNSAINQQTPIIVLTASANGKEETYAKKLNVQSYIGKPFPPELLVSEMKKILVTTNESKKISSPKITVKNTTDSSSDYFNNLKKSFKGKPKLQIEMFDIFLNQLPKAIEQMQKGLLENDVKLLHYEAHRLKSTVNIIGLPKLKPLITLMDEFCYKKINLEQLPDLYAQFKTQAGIDVKIILAQKEVLETM